MNLDGRFVAFESSASNLTAGDGNGASDVFVRDQQSGAVELVSTTAGGDAGNYASDQPSVSEDGNRIAFRSAASDLVSEPGLALTAIYVRDRTAGTTTRVSVTSDGTAANGPSAEPRISGDGRYVTFSSTADNLAPDDGNQRSDVFVHDLVTGATEPVSVRTNGAIGGGTSTAPAIDRDGRYVAFRSTTVDLVSGDTNGGSDVFLRDRTAGTTIRVSVTTTGAQVGPGSAAPAISVDGRVIAFESPATDIVADDGNRSTDIFVRNLNTLTTSIVSVDNGDVLGEGSSHAPTISADGRYVAFATPSQLVPDDENYLDDVYVRDRLKAKTRRISTTLLQGEVYEPSRAPALSGDGRSVAFRSAAPDLVGGDGNHVDDVFIKPVTVPSVSAVAPASITRGTSVTMTVNGTGFLPGVTVLVPDPGMSAGAVTVQSETKLTVPVTASPDATTGTATLWIVLPGTGAGATVSSVGLCPCVAVS